MKPPTSAYAEEAKAHPADYVTEGGLQMVMPYPFEFWCHVKKRWAGKSVIDLFAQEFKARPRSYYEEAFEKGRLRVEGAQVTASTPLKDSQRIIHFLHRHEPPVLSLPLQVVGVTDDVVAVSKPATWSVHATGQHRKNTVAGVLEATRPDLGTLHPVHRLDKPVSGLLLFARHPASADALRTLIQGHGITKVYVARVQGCFPQDPQRVDAPLSWDHKTNFASVSMAGDSNGGEASAREAVTLFTRLAVWPDGATSLVECRPLTGRTHQIRVHLKHLGHPIANDAQYGGTLGGPCTSRASGLHTSGPPLHESTGASPPSAISPSFHCRKAEAAGGVPSSAPHLSTPQPHQVASAAAASPFLSTGTVMSS
ncbi:hypothetical protein WJX84_010070 [Apatococcus fuscideae]|uniref:Pseudouridine synthase n=1 Tax=Apatococcus fuscideae TaxID=2026836 RepID=A0AAW1T1Q0_9CHLO